MPEEAQMQDQEPGKSTATTPPAGWIERMSYFIDALDDEPEEPGPFDSKEEAVAHTLDRLGYNPT